jgi:outer membrane protein assembly factor BamB
MGAAPEPPWRPDLWSMRAPRRAYPAVVAGGLVIVAGSNGEVFAVSARRGDVVWRQRISDAAGITAAPLLTADGLLVPQAGVIAVLDPATGDELRRLSLGDAVAREVLVTATGVYVLTASGTVMMFR